MAFSSDDLNQIRDVVRIELQQKESSSIAAWKVVLIVIGVCFAMIFAVLALHVLVIGGFTAWHLMHPSN